MNMIIKLVLRRSTQTIFILLGVTLVTFLMMHYAPGRPFAANPELRLDPTAVERWFQLRELDQPLPSQYLSWLSRMVRGDFGTSLIYNRPVTELLVERLPATLMLTLTSFLISLSMAVTLGTAAAVRRGSAIDRAVGAASLAGISVPGFWLGLILMMLFAYRLPLLPAAGMRTPGDGSFIDVASHMVLPLIVLSAGSFAYYVRFVRFAVLDCLTADYVRTAQAKGLPSGFILIRHVLPNAAIPIVTLAALSLPMLFTGALITENVFSWPGVGRFIIASTLARDYPVIMFVNFSMAVLTALANLLADLMYLVVDPRVRLNQ